MTDLIGSMLGKYQLVARVGRGGMARVYKAYQASLDRHVAVKILHGHLAEDPDFIDRFEREATAVARLRHPNIVQVYDYANQEDLYYIVMEFVEGPTLKAEISERRKRLAELEPELFSYEEIIRIFVNLSDAIDYAHSRGMIHRDLKPGNIMFTAEGQILLTDFGLARMVYAKRQTRTGALSGTPAYMSPEQVQGGHVDQRSDIYSLGVILYELFSGRVPFTADTPYAIMTKHVTDEVPSIRETNPDFPIEVETVILRSLSKDPDSRYQSANEFAIFLQEALGISASPMPGTGVFAPLATMADSQEMMPISTYAAATTTSLAALTSPYRGLYAFREEDSPYFFGRETFSERLAVTLSDKSMAAVIGPSGSGKSSVVYAGLLPRLREEGYWKIIEMRPGSEPFHSLANAYIGLLEPDLAETARLIEVKKLASAMRNQELTLADIVKRVAEKNGDGFHPLLFVDQFEELYTLCQDVAVRRHFPNELFDLIEESRERADLQFSLVITLRADFMGQALTHRPFADALQNADVKLGPMTRAELARAIESPAAKKRVVFEAGLVDRILDDVGDEPGNLPLLEFALTLLWDRRTGRRMTHAAYDSIGHVEGSLARYADEVYEHLSVPDQDRARRVFTQMVRPGEGTEDTRRLAHRNELSEEDWALAQRLADARLVVTGRSPDGTETVEVVHEALIRGWGRLLEWMNSERAFRSWQERLRVALQQWENSDRDDGALLRGAPLGEAKEWLDLKHGDLSTAEKTYISASVDWRDRELREQEAQRQRELKAAKELAQEQQLRAEVEYERAEEQARSSKNLRLLSVILAGIFVIAVVAAVLAVGESRDAERQSNARATEVVIRSTAEAQAIENADLAAESASESAQARDSAETERFRADVAAQQALEARDDAVTERDRADAQANLALARQLAAQSTTLLGPQLDLATLLSLEANAIDNSAETQSSVLAALQASPNLITYLRTHPSLLQSVDFSPDGELLVTAGADGLIYLWDLSTQEIIQEFIGHDPTQLVNRAVFSPDGQMLATASDDSTVKLWDVGSGSLLKSLDGHTAWVQSVDFSPDGRRLVSGSGDRSIIVWDVESGGVLMTLTGHDGPLWDTEFSNDGSTIGSASGDGTVALWHAQSGQRLFSIAAHTGAAFHIDFSPDDELIATGGGDGLINFWDVQTGEINGNPLTGHVAGSLSVEFSPDGLSVASSSADSTVRVWDLATRQQRFVLTGHSGLIPLVSFSPDGQMLASGDGTGTLILWDVSGNPAMGRTLTGHVGGVNDLALHPFEDTLLTAGADSTIRFWDINEGIQVGEPVTHGLRINEPVTVLKMTLDNRLISGSQNGTLMAWDVRQSELIDGAISALVNGITAIEASPDNQFIVAGSENGFTGLWDINSGNQIGPFLSGHNGPVTAIAVSPDSQYFATGGEDGSIVVRGVDGIQVGQLAGIPANILTYEWPDPLSISGLLFSADGRQLISSDNVGNLTVWDPLSREMLNQVTINGDKNITSISLAPDELHLALAVESGSIYLMNTAELEADPSPFAQVDGRVRDLAFGPDSSELWAMDGNHTVIFWEVGGTEGTELWRYQQEQELYTVELNPEFDQLVLGLDGGLIEAFNLHTGERLGESMHHGAPFLGVVNAVAFSPDGDTFASAGNDGSIVLWGTESREPIAPPLLAHNSAVVNLAFSHDGSLLASGSCSQFHLSGACLVGEVILWDLTTLEPVRILTDTVGFAQALDFNADDSLLALTDCSSVEVAGVCLEGVVRLVDWARGETVAMLEGHDGFVWSVDFSPDGQLLASSSADNSIIVWDVASGQPVGQRLSNHGGPVRRVTFSPDGSRLASAGFDNLVFLWDVASGQVIGGAMAGYANNAMDVAFNAEGTTLVASSLDGSITLFDIDLRSWLAEGCKRANRNLRLEEWELFFGDQPYRETCSG